METDVITSPSNPRIKAVAKLHQKKYRDEDGLILIEGRHPVEEAIAAGVEITELFLRESEPLPSGFKGESVRVSESAMARMTTTDSPGPMLAVARRPAGLSGVWWTPTAPVVMGLVNLQDPGNVGTIIRSASAFGVNTLVMVGDKSADPYQPKVIRASAGLVFRINLVTLPSVEAMKDALKAASPVRVWGADAHQGQSYKDVPVAEKTLLLMGSEAHGLPQSVWELAQPLHIPMAPGVESLNVGVAGAILLAEFFQKGR